MQMHRFALDVFVLYQLVYEYSIVFLNIHKKNIAITQL